MSIRMRCRALTGSRSGGTIGKKTYAGYNQIELDGRGNVVDGVYQKFSTDEPMNLMFAAYARQGRQQ